MRPDGREGRTRGESVLHALKPINGPPHTADACASLLDGRLLVHVCDTSASALLLNGTARHREARREKLPKRASLVCNGLVLTPPTTQPPRSPTNHPARC